MSDFQDKMIIINFLRSVLGGGGGDADDVFTVKCPE